VSLRIASYNIHSCVGPDGREDAGRIAAVLAEMDADIAGLQEVLASHDPADNHLDVLAASGNYEAIMGPNLVRERGHYGNALLTRLPVLEVEHHELELSPDREPRGVLEIMLDARGNHLRMIVTHLGLRHRERVRQAGRLLDIVDNRQSDLLVLAGDINDWFAYGGALRRLNRRLGRSRACRTFPGLFPVLALDRLWVVPDKDRKIIVHKSPLARRASDHLPIYVDLDLPV